MCLVNTNKITCVTDDHMVDSRAGKRMHSNNGSQGEGQSWGRGAHQVAHAAPPQRPDKLELQRPDKVDHPSGSSARLAAAGNANPPPPPRPLQRGTLCCFRRHSSLLTAVALRFGDGASVTALRCRR